MFTMTTPKRQDRLLYTPPRKRIDEVRKAIDDSLLLSIRQNPNENLATEENCIEHSANEALVPVENAIGAESLLSLDGSNLRVTNDSDDCKQREDQSDPVVPSKPSLNRRADAPLYVPPWKARQFEEERLKKAEEIQCTKNQQQLREKNEMESFGHLLEAYDFHEATHLSDVEEILYGYEIKIKKVDSAHAIIVTSSARDAAGILSTDAILRRLPLRKICNFSDQSKEIVYSNPSLFVAPTRRHLTTPLVATRMISASLQIPMNPERMKKEEIRVEELKKEMEALRDSKSKK